MFTLHSGNLRTNNQRHLWLFPLYLIGRLALILIFLGSTFEFACDDIMISSEIIYDVIGFIASRIIFLTPHIWPSYLIYLTLVVYPFIWDNVQYLVAESNSSPLTITGRVDNLDMGGRGGKFSSQHIKFTKQGWACYDMIHSPSHNILIQNAIH